MGNNTAMKGTQDERGKETEWGRKDGKMKGLEKLGAAEAESVIGT